MQLGITYNKISKKILMRFYPFLMKLKFRFYGVRFGKNLNVLGPVELDLDYEAILSIGNNFSASSGLFVNPLCRNLRGCIRVEKKASLLIGNNVGVSSPCIWASTSITIGNNVLIGANSILIDTDAHSLDWRLRASSEVDEYGIPINVAKAKKKAIVIEDDVMIGANSIILKGVTIGARSIIGAGSVVAHSIPSDCIAAGNPCKVVKTI